MEYILAREVSGKEVSGDEFSRVPRAP